MLLELSLIKLPRLLIHSVGNIVGLFFSTLRSSYIHVGYYVYDVYIILMLFRHSFVRLEVPVCKVTLYIISYRKQGGTVTGHKFLTHPPHTPYIT
jgi:hypothetical protein